MFRKRFLAILALSVLVRGTVARAEYYAEYDLDGVLGNGPDQISAEVSDLVDVDVWVLGGAGLDLIGLFIEFCNSDGSLEMRGVEYYTPESWTDYDPAYLGDGCWSIHTVTLDEVEYLTIPSRIATLTLHAAIDQSLDDITHHGGFWLSAYSNDGFITSGVGCSVQIGGTTSTSGHSWGAIKGLFR